MTKQKTCPICKKLCDETLTSCSACGFDDFRFDFNNKHIERPEDTNYYDYIDKYRTQWLRSVESHKEEWLSIARSFDVFAENHKKNRDYKQAALNYREALKLREDVLDIEHPDVVKNYKDIASMYLLKDNAAHRTKTEKLAGETRQSATSPIFVDKTLLFATLQEKIIGQSEALRKLALIVKVHLSKHKVKRPATIFFAGPTGIGKTESILVLVDALNELTTVKFKLIRIDCNQYMENHRVSNLLGSPPGYKNSGNKTILSPLLDNPRCIILFDEIEKAHGAVLDAMMSAMDTGIIRLSTPLEGDADERTELDCRFSIICFSSNLPLDPKAKRVGFGSHEDSSLKSDEVLCKEALVKNGFRPEIAGRITCFLRYQPLSEEDIKKVIRLEIEQCANSYGLHVREVTHAVIDDIAEASGSKFGMRAFKQLIERKMGEVFADFSEKYGINKAVAVSGRLYEIEVSKFVTEDGEGDDDFEFIEFDEFDDDEFPF
jgi:ATP-dependent Clp protease ATP-binding subunit ClpA